MTKHDIMVAKIAKNSVYGSFGSLSKRSFETNEEFVVRMLKGDFEKAMGMSYSDFEKTRNHLVENKPEMLI